MTATDIINWLNRETQSGYLNSIEMEIELRSKIIEYGEQCWQDGYKECVDAHKTF